MSTQLDVGYGLYSYLHGPRIKWMKTVFDGSALSTNQIKRFNSMGGSGALNMVAVLSIVQQGNLRVQSR